MISSACWPCTAGASITHRRRIRYRVMANDTTRHERSGGLMQRGRRCLINFRPAEKRRKFSCNLMGTASKRGYAFRVIRVYMPALRMIIILIDNTNENRYRLLSNLISAMKTYAKSFTCLIVSAFLSAPALSQDKVLNLYSSRHYQ